MYEELLSTQKAIRLLLREAVEILEEKKSLPDCNRMAIACYMEVIEHANRTLIELMERE